MIDKYREKIYAGVLGKIIGVYLGRPVEGWSYEKIKNTFSEIDFYVNDITKVPLIVPDDDISGTFAFIRALPDNNNSFDITSKQIGDSWLNYIIEDKTILWFGGLSRSTEHTAFLRLKNGISAPKSGSIELNGKAIATQIGSEIFIDSWAMVCPNDPEKASFLAKKAASVSHDGIAVDAAIYLAAMESMAFEESKIGVLLDEGQKYFKNRELNFLIDEVRNSCEKNSDWKDTRTFIEKKYGYDKYMGNCPIETNHMALLMSLIYGKDDFQKSISIATSAGWDTDCNSGNVGCLNGIRLGLNSINSKADFRGPVSDRMLVVTSNGGSCLSDAVNETRKLINISDNLYNKETINLEKVPFFNFEFPGSIQGFQINDSCGLRQAANRVYNQIEVNNEAGLVVDYYNLGKGMEASIVVDTYTDLQPKGKDGTSYFEVFASPSLYATQNVTFSVKGNREKGNIFVEYYQNDSSLKRIDSPAIELSDYYQNITWQVPDTNGYPIYRLGFVVKSDKSVSNKFIVKSISIDREPEHFHLPKSYLMSPDITPWTTDTIWLKSFMSSAKQFFPDYTTTFSLSHPENGGVVTIGLDSWKNYSVESEITFMMQKKSGLVIRSKGHKRYYAFVLCDQKAQIICVKDDCERVLKEVFGNFNIDSIYKMKVKAKGNCLKGYIDNKEVLSVIDDTYHSGCAGFVVDTGAILIDEFTISRS